MSKETTNKLVPKLRFPEFKGAKEWNEEPLGNIMTITSCKRVHQSDWTTEGVPFFRAREIVALKKKEKISPLFISEELYAENIKLNGEIKPGHLLVTGVGSIGVPYLVKNNDRFYFKDGNIIWLQNEEDKLIGNFLYLLYESEYVQKQITKMAGVGTVGTYTIDNANRTLAIFPEDQREQQKIADCLSSLDELITAQTQKWEALKDYKKGLMQQLFPPEGERTPKLRFKEFEGNGEWEEEILEKLTLKIGDGIHTTPIYDETGEYFFINGNNLIDGKISIDENTKRVSNEEYLKHKKNLNENTILLSINGTIGNISFYNNEMVILGKSACYINVLNKLNKFYLFYLLQSNKLEKYFESEQTGSTIKNLSLKSIRDTVINFPSKPEQQKIGQCLSFLDELITAQTEKMESLKEHKKGLMQQLFPNIKQ